MSTLVLVWLQHNMEDSSSCDKDEGDALFKLPWDWTDIDNLCKHGVMVGLSAWVFSAIWHILYAFASWPALSATIGKKWKVGHVVFLAFCFVVPTLYIVFELVGGSNGQSFLSFLLDRDSYDIKAGF